MAGCGEGNKKGKRLTIPDVDNRLKDVLDALQGRCKHVRRVRVPFDERTFGELALQDLLFSQPNATARATDAPVKSAVHAQRCLSVHGLVLNLFRVERR